MINRRSFIKSTAILGAGVSIPLKMSKAETLASLEELEEASIALLDMFPGGSYASRGYSPIRDTFKSREEEYAAADIFNRAFSTT